MEKHGQKFLSPETKSELTRLLSKNLVYGFGCFVFGMLATVAVMVVVVLLEKKEEWEGMITAVSCAGMFLTFCVYAIHLCIAANIEAWGADVVGRWCRNKAFVYVLMLDISNLISSENRCRTLKLVQRIKQELQGREEDPRTTRARAAHIRWAMKRCFLEICLGLIISMALSRRATLMEVFRS